MSNMKLVGDKVNADSISVDIDVNSIIGVYPVVKRHDEDGKCYYEVSDKPDGRLLMFKVDGFNKPCAIYLENSVETSQLIDLL